MFSSDEKLLQEYLSNNDLSDCCFDFHFSNMKLIYDVNCELEENLTCKLCK